MTTLTRRDLVPPWPEGTLCRDDEQRVFIVLSDEGGTTVRVLGDSGELRLMRRWLVPLRTAAAHTD